MKRYSKKKMKMIKDLDILTYFKNYRPEELVRNGRNGSYFLKSHDSLKLSNGMWYWWSQGIGGRSALDYLIKVEGWSFEDAVPYLYDLITLHPPVKEIAVKEKAFAFIPPVRNETDEIVKDYLINERGLDESIVNELIDRQMIYEAKFSHDVVFIGWDDNKNIKFGCQRSTNSNQKKDCYGSDKRYSFNVSRSENDVLHLFESAIDLISYMTLETREGLDWSETNYLSLSGLSGSNEHLPIALIHYLDMHPSIETIVLHLDQDQPGQKMTEQIMECLKEMYVLRNEPPRFGKDINEDLKYCIEEGVNYDL